MTEVYSVKTKKDIKEFLDFPLRLYKGNKYFVPPLYGDERDMFTEKNTYRSSCEFEFFLARKDGKTAGRIGVILQKDANKKYGDKRVRFTRFDCIDDEEVAGALFNKIEEWAKEKGMDTVCGPLGFSDLEREGLLIEGFDYLSTFEEQYNYPYYQKLIENQGYAKETDWVERRIFKSKQYDENFERITKNILDKYNLKNPECKDKHEFISRYGNQIFDLLDKTYYNLYQTVPFSEEQKNSLIASFELMIDVKHTNVVVDENDRVVCFGVTLPSLSEAVRKSNGHMTPLGILRMLHAIKHPKAYDLGLIGVDEQYAKKGVASYLIACVYRIINTENIEYLETNLNLEDNYNIINNWKRFNCIQHKRRRSFIKKI